MLNVNMDLLSLEDQRKDWASLGDARLADFVNNPGVQGLIGTQGLSLKEESINCPLSQLRPFGYNTTDSFFIAFHRR